MKHKLYLSGPQLKAIKRYRELFPKVEINALISYGTRSGDYRNIIIDERHLFDSLIADSGAFTKNNSLSASANKISLQGYIEFLRQTYPYFDYCMNYDEDFYMDGFDINTPMMNLIEVNGFQVVPVLHDYIGERKRELEYYIEKKYPIIALGFSEHKMKNKIANIKTAVKKALAANMKIHLLGVTSLKIYNQIPAHFSDSSSWSQYTKFGYTLWLRKVDSEIIEEKFTYKDTMDGQNKSNAKYLIETHPLRDEFLKFVKDELGITYNDLNGQKRARFRDLVNIHYFVTMQDEIRKIHQDVIRRPEWAPYFGINNDITETMKGEFDPEFLSLVKETLDL